MLASLSHLRELHFWRFFPVDRSKLTARLVVMAGGQALTMRGGTTLLELFADGSFKAK
jgi:hypothetical protein